MFRTHGSRRTGDEMTYTEKSVGVVIGASSGIGASVADLLARTGHRIVAASRRGSCPTVACTTVACDIRVARDVSNLMKLAQSQGRVAWVVNAAGTGLYAPMEIGFDTQWQAIVDTNIVGLINLIAAVKDMTEPPRHVIQIGSLAAIRPSRTPGNSVYSATKAASMRLFQEFRTEIHARSMPTKTTLITPGYVGGTDFTGNYFAHTPAATVDLLDLFPPLTPGDVAAAVAYALAQPEGVEVSEVVLRPAGQPD